MSRKKKKKPWELDPVSAFAREARNRGMTYGQFQMLETLALLEDPIERKKMGKRQKARKKLV